MIVKKVNLKCITKDKGKPFEAELLYGWSYLLTVFIHHNMTSQWLLLLMFALLYLVRVEMKDRYSV